jgi:hypothetical protein
MGFKPMMPAFERVKTVYASDCVTTVTRVIKLTNNFKSTVLLREYNWNTVVTEEQSSAWSRAKFHIPFSTEGDNLV